MKNKMIGEKRMVILMRCLVVTALLVMASAIVMADVAKIEPDTTDYTYETDVELDDDDDETDDDDDETDEGDDETDEDDDETDEDLMEYAKIEPDTIDLTGGAPMSRVAGSLNFYVDPNLPNGMYEMILSGHVVYDLDDPNHVIGYSLYGLRSTIIGYDPTDIRRCHCEYAYRGNTLTVDLEGYDDKQLIEGMLSYGISRLNRWFKSEDFLLYTLLHGFSRYDGTGDVPIDLYLDKNLGEKSGYRLAGPLYSLQGRTPIAAPIPNPNSPTDGDYAERYYIMDPLVGENDTLMLVTSFERVVLCQANMKKPKIAEWNYSESLYLNVWYDTIMSDFEGLASKYCPLLDNPKFRRGFVDFILVHPSAGSDSIQPVPNEKGSAAER